MARGHYGHLTLWVIGGNKKLGGRMINISSQHAWDMLKQDPDAVLLDVRSMVEWAYVGVPDLSSLHKDVVTIEWSKMTGQPNAAFSKQLEDAVPKDKKLLVICRAGIRSHAACQAAAQLGYAEIYNIEDGFDGQLDDNRQRKSVSGWCASGLPWIQD